MKKFGLFFVMTAAFMLSMSFASCDKLDSDDKTSGDDQAFFPISYADKTVAAWYSLSQKEDNKTRTEAVFLFTDSTLVVTKNKVYSKEDGRNPERSITAEAKYKFTQGSDYTNGTALVTLSDSAKTSFEVTITDGKLSAMGEIFTKQDNSKVPTPKQPSDNNGNGGNNQGGNNGGNNGDGNDLEPFFPKAYEGKSLAAWYSYSATEAAQGYEFKRTAAVYLFEDNTYVATINMSTSNQQYGQHSSCMIVSEGTYQKVEGNFTTGKITITDDKNSMTVEIQDGQLKIKDTETPEVSIYIKQDNTKLPKPSEPTDMGGGDNGGDNGDGNGTQAFFPITYAGMTVDAWYSNSHSDGSGTTVEAVFLFENDSLVVTLIYVPSQEAGGSTVCEILYEGTFTLTEGNYDNGTAQVYDTDDEFDFTVSIANGKLSAMSQTFTRQDNSKVPSPTWPTNMDSYSSSIK